MSRDFHTPRAQRRTDWTVDKIAESLATFQHEVARDHGRLVKFRLEEAELRVSEPRHLSTIDYFADMKSTAIADEDAPGDTMTVRYKVSRRFFFFCVCACVCVCVCAC